jgi:hypothetical protein
MRVRPDALNFFLADVRGRLGPYLAVYLLVEKGGGTRLAPGSSCRSPSIMASPVVLTTSSRKTGLDRPPTLRASGAGELPATADSRRLCGAVSSRQSGNAAVGWPEARLPRQESGYGPDGGVHRGGANRDGSDGYAGWSHGRQVGTQTLISGRSSRVAHPRRALHHFCTTRIGWWAYSSLTASARVSTARSFLSLADIMRGTGRFNVAQGVVMTAGHRRSTFDALACLLRLGRHAGAGLQLPESWIPADNRRRRCDR